MNRALSCLTIVGRTFAKRYIAVVPSTVRVIRPTCFYSSSPPALRFMDNENTNAHDIMVNDPSYNETVVNPSVRDNWLTVTDQQFHTLITQDFRSKSVNEMCDDFQKISLYVSGKDFDIVHSMFDGLRNQLISVAPQMTDEQMLIIFEMISLWNLRKAKDPVFYQLWSVFDKQCVERYGKWSLNKVLLYMDHWYLMRLSKLSNFVWLGIRKLGRKPSRLTPKQLVQMMFYANTSRKFSPSIPMYDIEQEMCTYYNDFNVKELGIISLGFFKTETPIRNQELVKNLYISVINNISNINSIDLAAFLKIFRYCTKHINADFMNKLMDVLVDKVDEVQLLCWTHMALLGTNLLIKHEDLLKKVSQKIVDNISQARMKDLERITLALTMLNCDPKTKPCIFETIVNELQNDSRKSDIDEFPRCYIFTLSYLAVRNIFLYDCITKALNIETLHKCFGKRLSKYNITRDILTLNNSLLIECPDYTGSLLPNKLRESLNEYNAWINPTSTTLKRLSRSDQSFIKLNNGLLQIFKNESYLHVCFVLPHHPKPDILFCIGEDGKPVTIPEVLKENTILHDFKKPAGVGKWFAVIFLVKNSVIYYSNEYNGLTSCKIRQIKKLGYEPILVNIGELENNDDIRGLLLGKLKFHGINLN